MNIYSLLNIPDALKPRHTPPFEWVLAGKPHTCSNAGMSILYRTPATHRKTPTGIVRLQPKPWSSKAERRAVIKARRERRSK